MCFIQLPRQVQIVQIADTRIFEFGRLKLVFANSTISSCFFFFLIDLYFLILAIIAQIFDPNVELIIPLEILTKEAIVKMEIHTVTQKLK